MKKYLLASLALSSVPFFAFAQGDLGNVGDLVESLGTIVDTATPIVVGIALLAFFWGLAKYIFSANDDEKKKEGRNIMIWGVVALFVMVSVWGLVRFIGDALDIEQGGDIPIPEVNLGV